MSGTGLPIQSLIDVTVTLSPTAAAERDFGVLLMLGDSNVIDTDARYREYTTLSQVVADFGTSAPEYLSAVIFFAQNPRPDILLIGKWARTATKARLYSAVFSAAQQASLISSISSITNGKYNVSFDGGATILTSGAMNFTGVTTMSAIAALVNTSLSGLTCTWNAVSGQFIVERTTTGVSSRITAFYDPSSGTDVSVLLKLRETDVREVRGIDAETALVATNILLGMTISWYGLMFAAATMPSDSSYLEVAAAIEAASPSRIFGVTSADTNILSPSSTSDIAYSLRALGLNRTFVQYASGSPYSCAAIFGRAFTVDFRGNNTTITLMFKQEVGVVAEVLTQTQAAAVRGKNCNVFVRYNNGTAIIQFGTMSSGQYFDVIHGTDWLADAIQTGVYNLLYQSTTKIPLTDEGVHQVLSVVESVLSQGVTNGLVAPGVWNGGPFGVLTSGQFMPTGFYTYTPPVSSLTAGQRAARQAPPIQCAINLGNAIHEANVAITVNS
jgi:hypothetical protein